MKKLTVNDVISQELERALALSKKVDENRILIDVLQQQVNDFESGEVAAKVAEIARAAEKLSATKEMAEENREILESLKDEALKIKNSSEYRLYTLNKKITEQKLSENESLIKEAQDLLTSCGDLAVKIVDGRRVTLGDTLKLVGVLIPVGISAVATLAIANKSLELDQNGRLSLTAWGKALFSGRGGLIKF